MSWNHRVVKRVCPITKESYYRIEEAFYMGKDKKKPTLITEGNIIQGDTIKNLEWVLKQMLKALKTPVIDGDKYNNKTKKTKKTAN